MKIAHQDWTDKQDTLKENLSSIIDRFWEISKLDVELDNETYFYEVEQARIYFDADKIVNKFNLDIDEFDIEDCYYDYLNDKLNIRVLCNSEVESEVYNKIMEMI